MNSYKEHRDAGSVGFSGNLGTKLTFFMIGCGIGAVTALLFAPKPGIEIRGDIADLAEKGYDKTLATVDEVKHKTTQFYETAKERGSEVLDVVSAGAATIKKEVASDVEKIGAIIDAPKARSGDARPAIF